MALAVGDPVGAAVVTGGDGDGCAERRSVSERLVEGGARLGCPRVLALPPADADRGRHRDGVRRLAERVQEAGVGVGREVHDQARPRGQCTGDLDVQQHLAVGAVRVGAGRVHPAVHPDPAHRRPGDAQPGEVGVELGLGVAAAELEDRQGLAGAVQAVRKAVHGAELERGEAHRTRRGGGAEPGSGLRPVVQTEDGGDHPVQLSRHAELAGAVPVADLFAARAPAGDGLQRRTEDPAQHRHGAGDPDPPGRGVGADHLHAEPAERSDDEVHICLVSPVGSSQHGARPGRGEARVVQLGVPAEDQGGFDLGVGRQRRRSLLEARCRGPLTSWKRAQIEVVEGVRSGHASVLPCIRAWFYPCGGHGFGTSLTGAILRLLVKPRPFFVPGYP